MSAIQEIIIAQGIGQETNLVLGKAKCILASRPCPSAIYIYIFPIVHNHNAIIVLVLCIILNLEVLQSCVVRSFNKYKYKQIKQYFNWFIV